MPTHSSIDVVDTLVFNCILDCLPSYSRFFRSGFYIHPFRLWSWPLPPARLRRSHAGLILLSLPGGTLVRVIAARRLSVVTDRGAARVSGAVSEHAR